MFIVLFGRIIGLKIILRLCRTFSCNILIIHYFINDQPFFFIAKPNNYTILHADSLNINDSSPLKFIEGLKFIFGIQNKIKCIFDHKSKNSKRSLRISYHFFNCKVLSFIQEKCWIFLQPIWVQNINLGEQVSFLRFLITVESGTVDRSTIAKINFYQKWSH